MLSHLFFTPIIAIGLETIRLGTTPNNPTAWEWLKSDNKLNDIFDCIKGYAKSLVGTYLVYSIVTTFSWSWLIFLPLAASFAYLFGQMVDNLGSSKEEKPFNKSYAQFATEVTVGALTLTYMALSMNYVSCLLLLGGLWVANKAVSFVYKDEETQRRTKNVDDAFDQASNLASGIISWLMQEPVRSLLYIGEASIHAFNAMFYCLQYVAHWVIEGTTAGFEPVEVNFDRPQDKVTYPTP